MSSHSTLDYNPKLIGEQNHADFITVQCSNTSNAFENFHTNALHPAEIMQSSDTTIFQKHFNPLPAATPTPVDNEPLQYEFDNYQLTLKNKL